MKEKKKGKTLVFAKLEARNGQCRLSINVKKIYAGGNDMGVYLLSSGQEIFFRKYFLSAMAAGISGPALMWKM